MSGCWLHMTFTNMVPKMSMVNPGDSALPAGEVYCSECGDVISQSASFCPECGAQHGASGPQSARSSSGEHLPYWHDDNILSRYLKFWGDKRTLYQILDLVMLVISAGFFLGWIGMEVIMLNSKRQSWDGASKYYADIEEGELA